MMNMRKTVLKVSLLASALTMSIAANAASEKDVAVRDENRVSRDVAGLNLSVASPLTEQEKKPKGPRLPPASKK